MNWTWKKGMRSLFFYLSADRKGPEEIAELHRELRIGQHGQYALGFWEQVKDKPIHSGLMNRQAPSQTLKGQLEWWLSFIAGVQTEARTQRVASASVKTTFCSEGVEGISPLNTGAGNNYLLKLLVMCLTARPGQTLLIESPEIHLHPGAQSRLGHLFGVMAAAAVQLVLETHCEHLINRIRYEIFTRNLASKMAVLYYKSDVHAQFMPVWIDDRGHFCDADGGTVRFPEGFFDATLAYLLEMQ